MAIRYGNPKIQYFYSNGPSFGEPLVDGYLYFYDSGTLNLKATYADSGLSIVNPNPMRLDGAGRISSPFLDGNYKVILQDSTGAQQFELDPIQGSLAGGQWEDWDITTTYSASDIVRASDDFYYQSITSNNLGNNPINSSTVWSKILFIVEWNDAQPYSINDIVQYDGAFYTSLTDNNLNNQPDTSGSDWVATAGEASAIAYDNTISRWDDSTVQEALDTIYPKIGKNLFINGNLIEWIRGVSFPSAPDGYYADRYRSSAAWTTLERSIDVPLGSAFSAHLANAVANLTMTQGVELPRTGIKWIFQDNDTFTVQIQAKIMDGTGSPTCEMQHRNSTGDSTGQETIVVPTESNEDLTNGSWKRYTFNLPISAWTANPTATVAAVIVRFTGAMDVYWTAAQLEESAEATEPEFISLADNKIECSRYARLSDVNTRVAEYTYEMRAAPAVSGVGPYLYDAEV